MSEEKDSLVRAVEKMRKVLDAGKNLKKEKGDLEESTSKPETG